MRERVARVRDVWRRTVEEEEKKKKRRKGEKKTKR
jgi:hypothetical protein